MGLQDEEPDHLPGEFPQDILDREEIVLRLAHLLVLDGDEAIVQPITGKALVIADAGL